jgi:hypothetical protein
VYLTFPITKISKAAEDNKCSIYRMGCSLHPGGHGHSHSLGNNSGEFDTDEEKVLLTASDNIQTEILGSYGALSNSYSGMM